MLSASTKKPLQAKAAQLARSGAAPRPGTARANALWEHLATRWSSSGLQAKLAVSAPDDPCEREANRIADEVIGMPQERVQRKCAGCIDGSRACPQCDEEEKLQRQGHGVTGPASVSCGIVGEIGAGRPLEPSTRAFFEPRFGRDFTDVRVHTNGEADAAAKSVNALAFTLEREVVFRRGQYAPDSISGRTLLAHELTHVVQQDATAPHIARQAAAPDVPAAPGECATRCGGIPSECPEPFCCPFPLGTATAIREAIMAPFLAGIATRVPVSVVPVWRMWFTGGAATQNFTSRFGSDFATDTVTRRVARILARRLASELDATALQPLASAATPGSSVSLLPALPPHHLTTTSRALEDDANRRTLLMDFNVIGTVPGNLAGGIGKTQTTCAVGAMPSPLDDARLLRDVLATLVRNPDGSITVTPSFTFHVIDTVDLCPGNCGSGLGIINEQLATFPMSRLEASGVSGDVPFTVDFTTAPQSPFTIPPPAPPAPVNVTISGGTLFDFGSDHLRPGAEAALLAQLGDRPLHADLTQPFLIEGHTDSRGTELINQPLSERRARRVAELLERRFPNLAGRLTIAGFGASRPVSPNTIGGADNPAGRALNRRVEIHFSAPPPP
jgi:outer membrane protein OmpA-like peptidoglycan-associated protein